jgi:4-amino-4-deoxychorismate lyase
MTEWFRDSHRCDVLPADDRGLQYGDGLFETVAIRDGAPRLWNYHVERLQTGAARLGLPAPTESALRGELDAALDQAGADVNRCTAKLLMTAGEAPRGYRRTGDAPVTLLTGIAESRRLADACYREGIGLRLCNTRLAIQPQLAGMKTLNRLEQVLARNEWQDDSAFEGLTLDTDGRLVCGTMSNVFLIIGQQLITPAITRCGVSGVMRRHVLTLLDEADVDFQVRDVDVDELRVADGVFISNSQVGILAARRCGPSSWQPHPVFRWLTRRLRQSGVEEGPA